jgi:hypothetical protein
VAASGGLAALLATGVIADEASHRGGAATDPAKVVGPEKCGECHKAEVAAWKLTHHATTFLEMHRKPEAKEIVTKLGGKRIKVNEHCLTCHYTEALHDGEPKALWGVTCEACHGAARDFVDVHNSFGPKGATKETETPEHEEARFSKAVAAGMIRPSDLYRAAANCFQCHTVPDEELVNVGGHKPRSDFELVAWSQGEVRHNYQHSPDQKNRPASPARRRLLYVTGLALDLEYSLRAAARATKPGPFLDAAAAAVARAQKGLEAVQAKGATPEVAAVLAAASGAAVKPGQGPALTRAADAVGKAARALVDTHTGSKLAGIDALLPAPATYRGKAQP